MAETELTSLTKALNDNSQFLRAHAQTVDINTRAVAESTNALGEQLQRVKINDAPIQHAPIQSFGGNPKYFEIWVKEIEKYAFIRRSDDRQKMLLAYQYSTGIVSDYIKRYLDTEPNQSWESLRGGLSNRFSPSLDKTKSFELLVNAKQKKDEDVQFYGERILELAQQAYPDRTGPVKQIVESQLLTIFLSGLSNPEMRMQIERARPTTFIEAYEVALQEQSIQYRCAVRRSDRPDRLERRPMVEPMEVDHMRRRSYGRTHKPEPNRRTDRQTSRGCWGCGDPSHKQRNCPKKNLN